MSLDLRRHLALGLVVMAGLIGSQAASAEGDKGRRILEDTKLFPDSASGPFLRFVESMGGPMSTGLFGTGVSAPQAPLLAAIEEKYGKADRVESRKRSTSPGPPFDAHVSWYGEFGFCVPEPSYPDAAAAGKAIYVLWDRKAK